MQSFFSKTHQLQKLLQVFANKIHFLKHFESLINKEWLQVEQFCGAYDLALEDQIAGWLFLFSSLQQIHTLYRKIEGIKF